MVFFKDNISSIGKEYTEKEQVVYVRLKAKYIEKKKKRKKNIAVCSGVLSGSVLFFESKKSKNWHTIPNNVVN